MLKRTWLDPSFYVDVKAMDVEKYVGSLVFIDLNAHCTPEDIIKQYCMNARIQCDRWIQYISIMVF
jgi:hypothetical protein